MISERFLMNMNLITTFALSCEIIIKNLEKVNLSGKKILENILNNLFEINIIHNNINTPKANLFNLFENVDDFNKTELEFEIQSIFKKLKEMIQKIKDLTDSFEKNFIVLLDYFKMIIGAKDKEFDYLLLQNGLSENFKQKDIRKFFIFMKLIAVFSKIKISLRKDQILKREISYLFEKKVNLLINQGFVSYEMSLDDLKYSLQLWIFRPYINDKIIKFFNIYLKEFLKN